MYRKTHARRHRSKHASVQQQTSHLPAPAGPKNKKQNKNITNPQTVQKLSKVQYLGWVTEIVPMRSARLSLNCIPTLFDLMVRPPAPPRPRPYPPAAGAASSSLSSPASATPTLNTCPTSAFAPQHFDQMNIKITGGCRSVGQGHRVSGQNTIAFQIWKELHHIAWGCVFPPPLRRL